jgi:hypothetical protein
MLPEPYAWQVKWQLSHVALVVCRCCLPYIPASQNIETASVWYYSDELPAYSHLYILSPGTNVVADLKLLHLLWVTYRITGRWESWDHQF